MRPTQMGCSNCEWRGERGEASVKDLGFIPLRKQGYEYLQTALPQQIWTLNNTKQNQHPSYSAYFWHKQSRMQKISLFGRKMRKPQFFSDRLRIVCLPLRYQFISPLKPMAAAKKILLLALILVLVTSVQISMPEQIPSPSVDSQYVPIAKRYPGIFIGSPTAALTMELVYDPTCDGSAAFDHVVRDALQSLDPESLSKINLKVAINILPYHITSEKIAIAVRYVQEKQGSVQALRVLRYFLDNIDSWDEKSIKSVTINQFLNNLAGQVSSLTGLPRDDIRKEIAHFSTTDGLTRQWSKYVMGSLRIPGTPFLIVNGARVDGATDMTAGQLSAFIKNLL